MYSDLSSQLSSSYGETVDNRSVEQIFGANLREVWYAEDATLVSGEVSQVTGRIYGLTLSAPSDTARPSYTASNAALGGAPTIDTAVTGTRYLINTAVPADFLPSGFPFLFIVGRSRVIPPIGATENTPAGMRRSATGDWDVTFRITKTNLTYLRFFNGTNRRSIKTSTDTNTHVMGSMIDGTGSSLFLDGKLYNKQAAGNTPLTGPVDAIAVGATGLGVEPDDYSCAVMGVCSAPPSSFDLLGLYQWAKRTFAVV